MSGIMEIVTEEKGELVVSFGKRLSVLTECLMPKKRFLF